MHPATYDAWYHSSRGSWISHRETKLMLSLLGPVSGASLLDVGAGTGHFTGCFAEHGFQVLGLEPDLDMLQYARNKYSHISFVRGEAENLPFGDLSFDYAAAVTSLCFVSKPEPALKEMWRISKRGILLGLLNRSSLLYLRKAGSGGYKGARWDSVSRVRKWMRLLDPYPARIRWGTAVFFPGGSVIAQTLEHTLPQHLPFGSFLAFYCEKN